MENQIQNNESNDIQNQEIETIIPPHIQYPALTKAVKSKLKAALTGKSSMAADFQSALKMLENDHGYSSELLNKEIGRCLQSKAESLVDSAINSLISNAKRARIRAIDIAGPSGKIVMAELKARRDARKRKGGNQS